MEARSWGQRGLTEGGSLIGTVLVPLLIALIPTYLVRFTVGGIPTTLWEVLLYFVAAAAIMAGQLRLTTITSDQLHWPLLLILLASLISLFVADDLRLALGQWKAVVFDAGVFYFLVRAMAPTPGLKERYISALVLAGTGVALLAIGDGLMNNLTADGRVIGIYAADLDASPNYLALFIGPIAMLTLAHSVMDQPGRRRMAWMMAAIVMIVAMLLAGSRGGLLSIALAAGVGVVVGTAHRLTIPRWTKVAGSLVILGLVGVGLFGLFFPDQSTIDPTSRLVTSNHIRLEIWKTTVTTILPETGLFGLGLGQFQAVFTDRTRDLINYPEFISPYALHPHNFLLASWINFGILGLIGWLSLLVRLGRRAWKRPISRLELAAGLALVTWFAHGLVDTTYYKNDLAPLFWLLVIIWTGALVGVQPPSRRGADTTSRAATVGTR